MVFTQVKWPVCPAGEHCQYYLLCSLLLANHIRPFLFFLQHYKQVKSRRGTLPHMCECVGSSFRFKTAFRNLSQNRSRGTVLGRKSGSFVLLFIRLHFTQLKKPKNTSHSLKSDWWTNPWIRCPFILIQYWNKNSNINPNNVSKGLRKVDSVTERFCSVLRGLFMFQFYIYDKYTKSCPKTCYRASS